MKKQKSLIQCTNISKTYHLDGIDIEVLRNINLTIEEGEFIAIMGPSGSGKSTLMHIIGLLNTPSTGTLLIDGKDVSKRSDDERADMRNQYIGFVFQSFFLLSGVNVMENVLLPTVYTKHKTDRKTHARDLLKKVGLLTHSHHKPNQLSGGQKQRVAIARSLINTPPIILADEPTGNLDSKTGNDIINIFKSLNRQGTTIVIVTHEAHVARAASRIVHIRDGNIINGNH